MNCGPFCSCGCHTEKIGNIRNVASYIDNLWDWSLFNDCLPGNIRIGDVDGAVEIGGHLLLLEGGNDGKNGRPRKPLNQGQTIMFNRITPRPKSVTVHVHWGTPHSGPVTEAMIYQDSEEQHLKNYSVDQMRRFIQRWSDKANGRELTDCERALLGKNGRLGRGSSGVRPPPR